MKINQLLSKASAVLCAALSAGTLLGSLPSLTAEAGTTPFGVSNRYTVQEILNDERQFAKNRVYQAVTDAVAEGTEKTSTDYSNFNVFYTTQLESTNFLVIYDPKDMDMYRAIQTSNGKKWANNYSKYLRSLSNITGISHDWNVCVFDTKFSGCSERRGDNAFFNKGASLGILSGVLYNKFTQSLLHETAHEFKNGYNYSDMLGNADEEVNVNLRVMCALHWIGLDTSQSVLTDYNSNWGQTNGIDIKYQYTSSTCIKPSTNTTIQKYLPTGSTIKNLNPTFIRISEVQYLALNSLFDTSSYQFFTRLGILFNYCTEKPVWACASPYNFDDANNWLNTDTLKANWNTISSTEWQKLSQLCITDSASIKVNNASGTVYNSIANGYDAYVRSCKTTLSYKYRSTKYRVKVSSNVNRWISENCPCDVVNGERIYKVSGNFIQALNCMDRLGVDFYSEMVHNKANNTSVKNFYLNMLGVDKGRLHAYTLTKV